jgi:hypothetical protein
MTYLLFNLNPEKPQFKSKKNMKNSIKTKGILVLILFTFFACKKDPNENITPNNPKKTGKEAKKNLIDSISIIYDEALATVYRGIRIPKQTAGQLGINNGRLGYFHIREFRVAGQVNKKAIALSILKHYGENVNPGASVLPSSNEPWVFNNFLVDNWSPNVREIEVKDNFGHKLKIKITLNTASNCWVTVGTINNLLVNISTQTYTTQVHNTCGFVEPVWTSF